MILIGDNCFLKLDWPLSLEARGGDSVMLESPKLKLSSVVWDSPSDPSSTAFRVDFSLFDFEVTSFWTAETTSLFDLLELIWRNSTWRNILGHMYIYITENSKFIPRGFFHPNWPSECVEFESEYFCVCPHFPMEITAQPSWAFSKQYLVFLREILIEKWKSKIENE